MVSSLAGVFRTKSSSLLWLVRDKTHLTVRGVRYSSHPPGAPSPGGERAQTMHPHTMCHEDEEEGPEPPRRERAGGPGKTCEELTRSQVTEGEARVWCQITVKPVGPRCRWGAPQVTGPQPGVQTAAQL